jgi:radical SAM protein with 4Fe4S-binding SPASM domain
MQVFFSHGAGHTRVTAAVADKLRPTITPWLDETDLRAGDVVPEEIAEAIESSDYFVAFLSGAALQSTWVMKELALARERERRLGRPFVLPVALDDDGDRHAREIVGVERLVLDCRRQTNAVIADTAEQLMRAMLKIEHEQNIELLSAAASHKGEGLPYLRRRGDIPENEWKNIYATAKKRIWLLGHAMEAVLEKSKAIVEDRVRQGVDLRVVVLNPDDATNRQFHEVMAAQSDLDLYQKVRRSLTGFRKLRPLSPHSPPQVSVGVTDGTIHNTIVVVDDRFLITLYSHDVETGNVGLTLDLEMRSHSEICSAFEKEFLWHWAHATPIQDAKHPLPQLSLRVLKQRERALASFGWYAEPDAERRPALPAPHLAVVFPTYHCQYQPRPGEAPGPYAEKLLCANCMYAGVLNRLGTAEMPPARFEELCRQLIDSKVSIIEIAGGGEPLHHRSAGALVETLARLRNDATTFGLISNLSILSDRRSQAQRVPSSRLLAAFSYIRWSWPENAEVNTGRRADLLSGLRNFVDVHHEHVERGGSAVRIGVKVLVTPETVAQKEEIARLVSDCFAAGVDHVKVRTLRTENPDLAPSAEALRAVTDRLSELNIVLHRDYTLGGDKTLEVDLLPRYVSEFHRCRLSTLMTVIDPSGNMRMCWNDVSSGDEQRVIGNVFEDGGFANAWSAPKHHQVCSTMKADSVCNANQGCHCRIVGYQEVVERLFSGHAYPDADHDAPRDRFL